MHWKVDVPVKEDGVVDVDVDVDVDVAGVVNVAVVCVMKIYSPQCVLLCPSEWLIRDHKVRETTAGVYSPGPTREQERSRIILMHHYHHHHQHQHHQCII